MSEIPEDVMKTARLRFAEYARGLIVREGEEVVLRGFVIAIMDERERAARIAENAPMEAWATHVDIARREAYKAAIAAAIRNAGESK